MSPQSSVAFHPAVFTVVLRLYENNKLIFRRHASENPGGLGAEPPRIMRSNSKTFRFSNRLSCLSPQTVALPQLKPWGRRGTKRFRGVSSPERAGSEAHTTGKNKQPGGSRRSPPTLLTAGNSQEQPYARSAPSSPPPLLPQPKPWGRRGAKRF